LRYTLQNGRKWGQDATIFPGWQRIGNAALKAARAPATWAPALGALGFQIGDLDERVSNWASDNTPVFGSIKNAKTQSDFLRELLLADYLITALATPSGQQPGEWVVAKAKGISVGWVAYISTQNTTGFLKQTGRTRPDGRGDDSFPSNHASTSAVMAMLASKNIDSLPISDVHGPVSKGNAIIPLTCLLEWRSGIFLAPFLTMPFLALIRLSR